MTAMTRSASTTPASMSSASPDASETCRIGTLRTSMGSGTGTVRTLPSLGHHGSRSAGGGLRDAIQRRDDGPLATRLDEPARGLDLRPHRTTGEVALGQQPAQLVDRDRAEPPLVGRAEADRDRRHVGRDHQHVGVDGPAEQRGRQILVDDRLHPAHGAVRIAHHRDAAAARGHHDETGGQQDRDRRGVEDLHRLRRRDHPAPALLAAVLPHLPVLDHHARLRLGQVPPDRLARLAEVRIVRVDPGTGHQRRHRLGHPARGERRSARR